MGNSVYTRGHSHLINLLILSTRRVEIDEREIEREGGGDK